MADKAPQTHQFETALRELETLVSALDKGDLSLEDALKTFEKGIQLTQSCQSALQHAEQRVQVLMQGTEGDMEFEAVDNK